MARSEEGEFNKREGTKRWSRNRRDLLADIGQIPAVADPDRRERCRRDLHEFLRAYFPESTGLRPFGVAHQKAIERLQIAILDGGYFVNVFPRGYGKTTIGENAAIWAILYGHRKFVPIFGADANAASGNIDSVKRELSDNDLLYEDFPEVCHAIRALEGKPQRCASQTHRPGNVEGFEVPEDVAPASTHISWTADTIVLPTIMMPDGFSAASGSILTTRGLLGGSRGMKHKQAGGTQQRPDFIIIDDPQTDESASSASQIDKRRGTIQKSILRLGGHGKRLAVVLNATIIQKDDLIEQMMDPKRFPAWQSERIAMVEKFAVAHDTLWLGEYARLRNTFDGDRLGDQQRAHAEATEFYRRNREAMDEGCEVSWSECYDRETELSAIQHAYNILIDEGEDVFASECQNEPITGAEGDEEQLTASELSRRLNHVPRGVVPAGCDQVTAFVDVQQDALFWVACAWDSSSFTGHVVDYGVYPEQPTAVFDYRKLRNRMTDRHKGEPSAVTYAGLEKLLPTVFDRQWRREDGVTLPTAMGLIDYGWEPSADGVFNFCRQRPTIAMPSKGKGIGAKKAPFDSWKKRDGERLGKAWKVGQARGQRAVLFETNYWKGFALDCIRTPMSSKTALYVFGDSHEKHKLFAEHCAAERFQNVTADGRTVREFENPPHQPDNHWYDGLIGCFVAASIVGVKTPQQATVKPAARLISFAQAKQQRTVHRVNRG